MKLCIVTFLIVENMENYRTPQKYAVIYASTGFSHAWTTFQELRGPPTSCNLCQKSSDSSGSDGQPTSGENDLFQAFLCDDYFLQIDCDSSHLIFPLHSGKKMQMPWSGISSMRRFIYEDLTFQILEGIPTQLLNSTLNHIETCKRRKRCETNKFCICVSQRNL